MRQLDVWSWAPPAKKLNPEEVDRIMDRLVVTAAVDHSQVPLNQPGVEDSAEMRLQRAILFDAVQCVVRHHDSNLHRQRTEARTALRWIESHQESYFLSFVPICGRFGIEPDWIRRLVRAQIRRGRNVEIAEAA